MHMLFRDSSFSRLFSFSQYWDIKYLLYICKQYLQRTLGHSRSGRVKHPQSGTQTSLKQRAGLDNLFLKSIALNGRNNSQHFQVLEAYQTQKWLNAQQGHHNIHRSPGARQGKCWPGSKKALRPTKVKHEWGIGTESTVQFPAPTSPPTCLMAAETSASTSQLPKLQKGCWACPTPQSLGTHKIPFGIPRQDLQTPWLSAGPGRPRRCHQQSHEIKAQPSIQGNGEILPSIIPTRTNYSWRNRRHCFGTILSQKG